MSKELSKLSLKVGFLPPLIISGRLTNWTEIYRIVSNKKLETTEDPFKPSASISVAPTVDSNANPGTKCC